jgi:riboflavin synthase
MFTGLIEEVGAVERAEREQSGLRLTITAPLLCGDLRVGDSVAVNGVCLTAVRRDERSFTVQAVGETIANSGIGSLRSGAWVNLERAMPAGGRLGGHFVLGHVDCISRVRAVRGNASDRLVDIDLPREHASRLIPKGSIAVDGVSLTIAELADDHFTLAVIPHTWERTTFRLLRAGQNVNLEFDVLGKYVERILRAGRGEGLTLESLGSMGY